MRKKARKTMGIVLALATLLTCLMVQGTDVNAGGPGYIPERGYYSTNEDEASNGTIVGPGGYKVVDGKSYNKLRFLYHHPIFKSYTEDTDSVVFYSDGFFDTTSGAFDPKNYNEHIASASMALAFSGMYLRANEEADTNGNVYYNKHAGVRQFFADMGCPDESIYVNESNVSKPGADTIGVAIASKELEYADGTKTGNTLIPVVVRGGGYEQEWASNMTLGHASEVEGKEAKGFSESATIVMDEIKKYIETYDLQGKIDEQKVTFWVTGYSRAGAVANIASKRLIEEYIGDGATGGNEVISYPCEAPKGGTDDAEKLSDKTSYFRIHNIINPGDIVPLVAPEEMGFKRYGVDHYIPGYSSVSYDRIMSNNDYMHSKAVEKGGNGGPATVTTYADNIPAYIKNVSRAEKASMKSQLKVLDPEIEIDDSFRPMTFDIFSFEVKESGREEGNHVEEFIKDFVYFLQFGDMPGNSNYDWSIVIKDRDKYADDVEPAMRDFMAAMYLMSEDDYNGFTSDLGKVSYDIPELPIMPMQANEMPYLPGVPKREDHSCGLNGLDLYLNVISQWGHLDKDDKDEYIKKTWEIIEQNGAFDHIDSYYRESIKQKWPKIIDTVFTFVVADYNYFPGGLVKALENPPAKWANACIPNEFGVCMPETYYEPQVDTVTTMKEPNERSLKWASGANDSMMFTGTFMQYSNYILMQHYPEINLAWLRNADSYYFYENSTEKFSTDGYVVSAPVAVTDEASGSQIVKLSVDDIVGEAIYYDLKNETTGEVLASNKLYQGGIELSLGDSDYVDYTITAYAISHGVRSETAEFKLAETLATPSEASYSDAESK